MTAPVRTTCPYCGVGCGVLATPDGQGGAAIAGDPAHPANKGRLCSKGSALGETLGLDGRLLAPEVDGRRVSWGEALDELAAGFKRIIAEHGPEAVAFYVSGQLLTEDYYAANKLLKGFIGSPHLDTNSRLCMASAVAGHRRGFGSDAVPAAYDDIEIADLAVITGSNLAWCHPVLFQRLMQAKRERPGLRIVVIDPRRTATAEAADLHLPLRPGSDVMLYNGLLAWLAEARALDEAYIAAHTEGFAAALSAARQSAPDIDTVAEACGVDPEAVATFFQWFKAFPRTVTLFSMGVNQSSSGTDKVNAILNVHLSTGRIGKPGAAPFSITGQPNAMGGREVGALANQLAAHMDYADPADIDRVRRFWNAPAIARKPGYKAVELIEAIERGAVKAVWVMATNPVVSLPDAARARRALASLPLLAVSDCVADTDTLRLARIKLPALAWGEKDGTVTNSERRISRQRPFLPAPGHAMPDWQIVAGVARRLGHGAAFAWTSVADVFREHAALSAFENEASGKCRRFDLGGLADLDDAAYAALAPVQWPVPRGARAGTERLFADGAFLNPGGRAQFVALTPRLPAGLPGEAYPLALITGRVRDHWHTMTRTAKSPRLSLHRHEPFVEMHPADLAAVGAVAGQLVAIESAQGRMIGRAHANHGLRPGTVFAPMHWNEVYARQGRVNEAVNPAVDPLSGQPEFKHTPVRALRVAADWHGFLLSRFDVPMAGASWWAKARGEGYWRYELAGEGPPEEAWRRLRKTLSGLLPAAAFDNATVYIDAAMGDHRAAFLDDGRLMAGLFLGREPDRLPPRDWLGSLFATSHLGPAECRALLAGRAPGQDDDGPLVCACFGVGRSAILRAIVDHDLATPSAVGAKLRAGTNCGSCLPEIALLVQAAAAVPKTIAREVA